MVVGAHGDNLDLAMNQKQQGLFKMKVSRINNISLSNFTESFYNIENDNLFFKKINNIPIWEFIRYEAFYILHDLMVDISPHPVISKSDTIKNLLKDLLYITGAIINNFKLSNRYEIFFINISRKQQIDGKKRCIYFYHIIDSLIRKFKILSIDPSLLSERIHNNYSSDVLLIRSRNIRDLITKKFNKLNHEEIQY